MRSNSIILCLVSLCIAGAVCPYSYEETRNISAKAVSLQGCNASICDSLDAVYLNPANIGYYSNVILQISTKSPLIGFLPSVNGAFGFGLPLSQGQFGIALTGDYHWDSAYYMEYAARVGFGWNMEKLFSGISFGAVFGVSGMFLNYSELAGLYSYTTNAMTLTFGCSLGFSPAPGLKGCIALDNVQFLGLFYTLLPSFLRSSSALPTTLSIAQSFQLAPDHTLNLSVMYYFPTEDGDLYEVVLGYTWAVLPYLLDINIAGKSINVIKGGAVSLGLVLYPSRGIELAAGWVVNINTPNFLGDIYVSTVFVF
ncbi:MAG: hypothetical protein AABZ39_13755 [Spirochaetota bacterium]